MQSCYHAPCLCFIVASECEFRILTTPTKMGTAFELLEASAVTAVNKYGKAVPKKGTGTSTVLVDIFMLLSFQQLQPLPQPLSPTPHLLLLLPMRRCCCHERIPKILLCVLAHISSLLLKEYLLLSFCYGRLSANCWTGRGPLRPSVVPRLRRK